MSDTTTSTEPTPDTAGTTSQIDPDPSTASEVRPQPESADAATQGRSAEPAEAEAADARAEASDAGEESAAAPDPDAEAPVANEPAAAEATPEEESAEPAPAEATTEEESAEPAPAEATAEEESAEPAPAEATAEEESAEPAPAVATAEEETAAAAAAPADPPEAGAESNEAAPASPEAAAEPAPAPAPAAKAAAAAEGPPSKQTADIWEAMNEGRPVQGKVIGWNKGGFHVVVDKVTAFCPRSEMDIGKGGSPKSHLDKTFDFQVLEILEGGRRIVLSRTKLLRGERAEKRQRVIGELTAGAVVEGTVASVTDFGAFVDLGGVQGLVHVSELKRSRVEHPSDVVEPGQSVEVKILKVENGGKRISLSMRALEPDPWDGVASRFQEGNVVQGTVEKVANFGAFVMLEPGLTGLLPAGAIDLPRGASLGRMYPPGKKVSVEIRRLDPRKKRISLALEGSQSEGSRKDFENYVKGARESEGGGFNAMAAALEKLKGA